jgi:predicted nucleic acid-binding protein
MADATIAERRGRIVATEGATACLRQLSPEGAGSGSDGAILAIAVDADDAVHLALGQERELSLAARDRKLACAARAEGVRVLGSLA